MADCTCSADGCRVVAISGRLVLSGTAEVCRSVADGLSPKVCRYSTANLPSSKKPKRVAVSVTVTGLGARREKSFPGFHHPDGAQVSVRRHAVHDLERIAQGTLADGGQPAKLRDVDRGLDARAREAGDPLDDAAIVPGSVAASDRRRMIVRKGLDD